MNYKNCSLQLWLNRFKVPLPGWEVVNCFYSALHATNSRYYPNSIAPKHHGAHQKFLQEKQFPFLEDYEELRDLSEQVRYCPHNPINKEKIDRAEKLAEAILLHIGII